MPAINSDGPQTKQPKKLKKFWPQHLTKWKLVCTWQKKKHKKLFNSQEMPSSEIKTRPMTSLWTISTSSVATESTTIPAAE